MNKTAVIKKQTTSQRKLGSRYNRPQLSLECVDTDERGNALWFILIAVGLLGLLTVTLTRSGSSTNETGRFEQNQIAASQILTYAKSIENAVQSLLARGCSENEISFENNVVTGYENPNSPTDNSCHVFDAAGAGMVYREFNDKIYSSGCLSNPFHKVVTFWGNSSVQNFGTEKNDLILVMQCMDLNICRSLNTTLKTPNPVNDVPNDGAFSAGGNIFIGTFGLTVGDPFGNDPDSHLLGKTSGCIKRIDGDGTYQFYHVLHAR